MGHEGLNYWMTVKNVEAAYFKVLYQHKLGRTEYTTSNYCTETASIQASIQT
ncbi:hypothetical protein B7P43_G02819 [Cryptotermes secundus]|uniref:Uncharacterized protein n=1 Tax=Cryptotermes secundus TaxID=105785 RepID=A0A2J7RSW9_9NEOP|nr:hypothetical protein B7P43_G02819 [Cryptotermes secundus]